MFMFRYRSPSKESEEVSEKTDENEDKPDPSVPDDPPIPSWVRSAPADVFFKRNKQVRLRVTSITGQKFYIESIL